MNHKMRSFFSKTDYYLGKNNSLLVFLLMLIGVMIPSISGYVGISCFEKLFYILKSPVFNMMLFLSIGITSITTSVRLSKNYYFITRYQSCQELVKKNIREIVSTMIIIYIMSFILAVAGSIIFSFGNMKMDVYIPYRIPMILYDVFLFLRGGIFLSIIGTLFYFVLFIFKKEWASLCIILCSVSFPIVSFGQKEISHFYYMPFFYHHYFLATRAFTSFFLEVICSILYLLFLIFIYQILLKKIILKKRELL